MKEQKNILSCWHKLEHFSPASLPKGKNIDILNNDIPWHIPLKTSDPKKTIEYTIYLGVFDSSVVNNFVKEYFEDSDKNENDHSSKICYASLKLDIDGRYLSGSFGVSSLPWALGQLENNKLTNSDWLNTFDEVKNEITEFIDLNFKETITNSDNEITEVSTIIDFNQLLKLQDKIESLCEWSVKPDKRIYLRRIEKFKSKDNNATSDILNSFYIKDLEKIISEFDNDKKPKAFTDYLNGSLDKKGERIDLSKNIEQLENNLTPNNYPDGCWPSDYTLSLMQQYAVNNIFNSLSETNQEGLFSVNGPPGTGKTTLLRDIIAPIIVKRAKELIKFENPSEAFTKIGSLAINEKYSPWLYAPSKSITNAGIVIASSNNGAVENISKELPLVDEVSSQYKNSIDYFKGVATKCINKSNWGIISAVLGNKENRNNLVSNLWFNQEFKDLQKTLKEDKIYDDTKWENIKSSFTSKLNEIEIEKAKLESYRRDYKEYISNKNTLFQLSIKLEKTEQEFRTVSDNYINQKKSLELLKKEKESAVNELAIIKSTKPNFFIYWLNKTKRNIYNKSLESALTIYNEVSDNLKHQTSTYSTIETTFNSLKTLVDSEKQKKSKLNATIDHLSNKTDSAKRELQNNYADIHFWENLESKQSQESCPWYSSNLKKLQSELFIISLKLTEIFILTANSKSSRISTTLAGFFEYLKGESHVSKEEVKAMWDTFFLITPVVSSTFASIQTMFKDLGKEDIPWLFIDEAGQAIPQASAGSIWRSKRVAVVGDPFQIEPVVTIPNSITNNISKYFGLTTKQISSELSVQSMADRINPLGSYLTINSKKEWIGIPLRVHRRCIDPMFEISNNIAYDNTMYCSTKNPKTVTIDFKTSFINCKGKVKGRHFVQEQADKIEDLLINEIRTVKTLPDVFVISPFSEISYQLKNHLFKPLINEVKKHTPFDNDQMGDWLNSHIGTVHTFQGKQADGVILCLGLDETTNGAANWASQKPNLLNVAITRAKYRFIAIGDEDIWFKQAYFNQLSSLNKEERMHNTI